MFFSGGGFPFPPGAFPGGFPGGGFPGGFGGHGHHHEEEEEEVDTSTLYALLEVSKEATQGEIRKAYLKISNSKDHPRRHPDKGGSAKLFAEVQGAYEILSDAEKRGRYDRGGESAANREGGGGGPGDLFETLFGGGGGGGGRRGPPKAEATRHPLRVTLEECYRGKTCRVRITRSVVRRDPNGNVMDRQQRRYMKTSEQEMIEVTLARGAKQGEKILFANKGDIQDGLEQGDVVLIVQIVEHGVFQRKGSDLICKRDVSLIDAISGVNFTMRSISGGVINVKSPPGMVIKPDSMLEVAEEGMPVSGHTQIKGSLFIKFTVVFPDTLPLTDQMKKLLSGIIKGPPIPPSPGSVAVTPAEVDMVIERVLCKVDMEQVNQREQLGRGGEESDEEEGGGEGGGVRCAQQ